MSQQRHEVNPSVRRLRRRYRLLGDSGLLFLRGNVSFIFDVTFRARLFLLPIPYSLLPLSAPLLYLKHLYKSEITRPTKQALGITPPIPNITCISSGHALNFSLIIY